MAHFEVPIIKITKVEDHPFADRLSLNYFREFVTISAKLEDGSHRYKEGDLAIYVPEAAIVPENLLRKGFWNEKENKGMLAGSKGNRTKAIKLRQIISQGIMFSVEMFEGFDEEKHFCFTHSFPDFPVKEGMDVSSLLGIIKYEPVIPSSMSGEVTNIGIEHKINFDVENIQKFPHLIQEGEEVIITEKGHGCLPFHSKLVTLEYGETTIGNIVDNKLECHIKSHDIVTNDVVYELVEGWQCLENNDDWYEIELEDGSIIEITGNHKIWIPNLGVYRKVEDLDGTEKFLIDK